MDDVKQQAEALLAEIWREQAELDRIKLCAQAALEWVAAEWAEKTGGPAKKLKKLETQLKALMKKHKGELFAAGDRLDLATGALLHQVLERVKRAKNVLANLQALDWRDAIRVVEEVRWEVLEDWPEEKLIACGTERVHKEEFVYEVYALREAPCHDPAGSLPATAGKKSANKP
jgi:hypothetical protein